MSKFSKLIRSAITMAVAVVMIVDFPVQALNNKYDADFFSANDIVIYDPEFKCHSSNNSLGDTDEVDGKVDVAKNAETVLRYFTAKGLSLASAAGFVGNMTWESGGINPRKLQGGAIAPINASPRNGQGFGIVQWTYTDRQSKLVALAKSTNRNTTDLDLQLDFVWKELNSGYKSTLQALITAEKNGTITPSKAVIIVHGKGRFGNNPNFADAPKGGYESSGDTDFAEFKVNRIAPGVAAYDKFKGTIADGTGIKVEGGASESVPTEDGGACDGTLNGDAFTVDGMAFPLIATEELIKKGSQIGNGRGVWCYKAATNCHHDYNAADIMAPPGTVVVAATDGEVTSARVGANGARCEKRDTITIRPADGDGVWFYTHLKNGSSVVKNGQKVKAGDKLAAVGPSGAADCTAPHLHIDHLPKPATARVSCASAACKSKGFVDIQPQMKSLYDQMVAAQKGGAM